MAGPILTAEQIQERYSPKKEEPTKEPVKEAPKQEVLKEEPKKEEPPKETPKQEEPKKEIPKTNGEPKKEEPKEPTPIETFNKTYGTKYESEDQIKTAIENANQFGELATKHTDLDKKFKELELKANIDPFANEIVKGYNELVRNGASAEQQRAYMEINSVDLDSLDHEAKTILGYKLKDGLNDREARITFSDEYKLKESDYDIDPALEDDELKSRQDEIKSKIEKENIRLKREAKGIDSFLSDYKKEVSSIEKPEDVFQKKWSEYEPSVKEIAPVIQKNYKGLQGVPLTVEKDGEPERFDFEVPDEFKKAIPQLVEDFTKQEFAADRSLKFNEEGLGQITNHLDRIMWGAYGKKFVLDASIHMASKVREEMANKNSNSVDPERGDKPPLGDDAELTPLEKHKRKMLGY